MKRKFVLLILLVWILGISFSLPYYANSSTACSHTSMHEIDPLGNITYHLVYCTEDGCNYEELQEHDNIVGTQTGHYVDCKCNDLSHGSHIESSSWRAEDDENHVKSCTICGWITTTAKHRTEEWTYTNSYHYKICSDCNFHCNKETHSSNTWIITSIRHSKECDECGATFSSGVHSYGTSTSITTDTHTRFCSVCDYSKVDDHAISSWTITSASHRGTCSVCNYTVFEEHYFKNGVCTKCKVSEATVNNMIEQGIQEMTITIPVVDK